jgi:hypothetical protein
MRAGATLIAQSRRGYGLPVGNTQIYRRIALATLVPLIVVTVAFVALHVYEHRTNSSWVHALGRDYQRQGGSQTLKEISTDGPPIIINSTGFKDRPAGYPKNEQPPFVYTRHGSAYWTYTLSGGP